MAAILSLEANLWFTQQDKDLVIQIALKDRSLNFNQIAKQFQNQSGKTISGPTISNVLYDQGLKRCKKIKVQFLTKQHMKVRLEWCLERKDLTIDYWSNILFSDESMFRETANGAERVTRYDHEKLQEDFVQMTKQSGGMHWMVWGAFNWHGYHPLTFEQPKEHMTAVSYINILKKEDIMGYCNAHNITYQQDNAPIHKAKITNKFFQENDVNILTWPARSPDLNPIENLWSIIKYRLRGIQFDNLQQFKEIIKEVWNNIDFKILQHLIESMPKRIKECIEREI